VFNSRILSPRRKPAVVEDFGGSLSGPWASALHFPGRHRRSVNNGNIINAIVWIPHFAITPSIAFFLRLRHACESARVWIIKSMAANVYAALRFHANDSQAAGVGNLNLLDRGTHI